MNRHRGVAVLVTAIASEIVGADVGMPKERARGGVVSPDLFLVIEGGLTLCTRYDHRSLPAALVEDGGWRGVVQAGGRDADESIEDRVREGELHLGTECRGQVRVVDPLPIAPQKERLLPPQV